MTCVHQPQPPGPNDWPAICVLCGAEVHPRFTGRRPPRFVGWFELAPRGALSIVDAGTVSVEGEDDAD